MDEQNGKTPGYFTKEDMDLADLCMDKLDYLRVGDEFLFRYDVGLRRIAFRYHKADGEWESLADFKLSPESFGRFRQLLLTRYDPDNRGLPSFAAPK